MWRPGLGGRLDMGDQISADELDDMYPTPPQGIPVYGYPGDWPAPWTTPPQGLPEGRPADVSPEPPGQRPLPRSRRYPAGISLAGLTGGLFFFCLSMAPSLLPRAWYLQALMSGVTVAIGYAVGLFAGWLARSVIPWHGARAARRAAAWALAVAAVVLVPLFGVLGAQWQHEIRALVGASQPSEARYVLVVVVAPLIALALISVARGLRWVIRLVARPLGRVRLDFEC